MTTVGASGTGQSFTFLQAGFTQDLVGTSSQFITGDVDGDGTSDGILGDVAFAPNGDIWVSECEFQNTRLHRYAAAATLTINGTLLHQEIATVDTQGGCGLTNHPDGTLYSNTSNGIANLDASTGAFLRFIGAPGSALGITVDPQTGHLVYVGADCHFTTLVENSETCTIYDVDPVSGSVHAFGATATTPGAVLSLFDSDFVDGLYFDPTGQSLFLSNRFNETTFGPRLTVLNRAGQVVQHLELSTEPDGVSFHAQSPKFVVTNDEQNGTMTRFDFPNDDYTQVPSVSVFASGGFRGDLTKVGADGCIYATQKGVRYDDGTASSPTDPTNSVVRVCGGFAPAPGVQPPPPPANTGTIPGAVVIDGNPPSSPVTVTLTDSSGSVVATTETGTNGTFQFTNVPVGTYTVTTPVIDGKTGTTAITVTVTSNQNSTPAVFEYTTNPPPPASLAGCVYVDYNSSARRDRALGAYGVFVINGGTLILNSSHIQGDVALGPGATGTTLQKTDITGTFYYHPGDIWDQTNLGKDFLVSGGVAARDLTQAQADANAASAAYEAMAATQSFTTLTASRTISRTAQVNVIRIGSVAYNSRTLTLSGLDGDSFVINVAGDFVFADSKILLAGGLKANNVVFNFPTGGSEILLYKATNVINGTFLAPYRALEYHNPATFNGQIIAKNVDIHSDAKFTSTTEPCLSGATMRLDNQSTAIAVAAATTDASGYRFDNLSMGTYVIRVTALPAGFAFSVANPGVINGVTVGVASGANAIGDIVLPAGGAGINYDFGVKKN